MKKITTFLVLALVAVISLGFFTPRINLNSGKAVNYSNLYDTNYVSYKPVEIPEMLPLNQPSVSEDAPLFTEERESEETADFLEEDKKVSIEEMLYSASLEYVADTPEGADLIARKIGFSGGTYESASNACGPISIAILKSAGILTSSTSVHDIWLLCPREEREECNGLSVLNSRYFPPEDYDYIKVTESVGKYDFVTNPLKPGDWLYLFASRMGFDHMLLVTRVDEDGTAYTVTNLNRGDGFKITEEVLYSPNKPGEGLFYELTNPNRGMLGMTGNGGFLLVRRKDGFSSLPQLNNELGGYLDPNASWNVLVKKAGSSDNLFESLPNQQFHPASMIKIPLAMVTLKILEEKGYFSSDLQSTGYDGRTLEQLMFAMVVKSEEDATESLLRFMRALGREDRILNDWGIFDTSLEPRKTTAYDMVNLLEGLYSGAFLNVDMRSYLLSLMSAYTENDTKYLGVLSSILGRSTLYNKRGTLLDPAIVADMGILVFNDNVYFLVISGTPIKDGSVSFEGIKTSIENFSTAFARIIKETEYLELGAK